MVGEMAEKEEWNSSGAVEGGGTGDTMAVRGLCCSLGPADVWAYAAPEGHV